MKVPKSGDRSLQTYGGSANQGTFAQIAATVRSYNLAAAAGNGAAACQLLAPRIEQQIVKTLGGGKQSCSQLLDRLFGNYPSALRNQLKAVRVTDARVGKQSGFAFFTMPGTPSGVVPLELTGGQWRVAALAGSSIP